MITYNFVTVNSVVVGVSALVLVTGAGVAVCGPGTCAVDAGVGVARVISACYQDGINGNAHKKPIQ